MTGKRELKRIGCVSTFADMFHICVSGDEGGKKDPQGGDYIFIKGLYHLKLTDNMTEKSD